MLVYNTLQFAPKTRMCILTPHSFDDAVRLGRRITGTPYARPDPSEIQRQRQKTVQKPNECEHVRVWAGRCILLSTSLDLDDGSRVAIGAGIQRAGGIVSITEDTGEDVEEKAVDDGGMANRISRYAFLTVMHSCLTLTFRTAKQHMDSISFGSSLGCLASTLVFKHRCDPPPVLADNFAEILITNYTDAACDYLERLIVLVGPKFTQSMSQSNKVLVALWVPAVTQDDPRTLVVYPGREPHMIRSASTYSRIALLTYTSALTVGLECYIVYPPGISLGKH
ncbi:hypothetical protein J3R83DRAFT_5817 [Lanmaoa asiatica]|nr:hypothetical protein J3R83DRAFT_5817 [Lanmaoa asiatica]